LQAHHLHRSSSKPAELPVRRFLVGRVAIDQAIPRLCKWSRGRQLQAHHRYRFSAQPTRLPMHRRMVERVAIDHWQAVLRLDN